MTVPTEEQYRAPDKERPADLAWNPSENAVLAQLLDHIAEELAREYVLLMELAAEEEASRRDDDPSEAK